ncbi:MAG: hypothetical protein QOG90_701, partial [Actinomycetota bacterium]
MKLKNVLVVFGALTLLAACGTRLPDSAFQNSATQRVAARGNGNTGDITGGEGDTTDTTTGTEVSGSNGNVAIGSGGGGGNTPTGAKDDGPNKASDVGVTEKTIAIGTIVAENGVLGDA